MVPVFDEDTGTLLGGILLSGVVATIFLAGSENPYSTNLELKNGYPVYVRPITNDKNEIVSVTVSETDGEMAININQVRRR
jgi:hypothetical protein